MATKRKKIDSERIRKAVKEILLAVGENVEVSELLGINSIRMIQLTFALSGAISAGPGLK